MSLLDKAAAGQQLFDTLFLTQYSPLTTYDYIFHITVPAQQDKGQLSDLPLSQRIERKVHNVVTQVMLT